MSMTPERIEEIRQYAYTSTTFSAEYIQELLAALEETEHQISEMQEALDFAVEAGQSTAENVEVLDSELAEAQQTIARQREALEYYASGAHIELNAVNQFVSAEDGCKARKAIGKGAKES